MNSAAQMATTMDLAPARGPRLEGARSFGRYVRRVRDERGLTAAQLGEATGLNEQEIAAIEAGKSVSLRTLCRLADGLDLMLSDLFDRFEMQDQVQLRELVALLRERTPKLIALVVDVVRTLVEGLDDVGSKPESE